jgi:hypothetical protein
MVGHLADGLHAYWRVTRDEKAKEAILRAARWMHTECIVPTGMPYYTDRPDYPEQNRYWPFRVYTWAAGEVTAPAARAYLLSGDRAYLTDVAYIVDNWLHYYWGGGWGAYRGCPLAVYALNSAGLEEKDLFSIAPQIDLDAAANSVRAFVAKPPPGETVTPSLIVDLGRLFHNRGLPHRGLETYSELAAAHGDRFADSSAPVCDLLESRLAAAGQQYDRAEAALLRYAGRYDQADPEDPLSRGHFRAAWAYDQLARLLERSGAPAKAREYRRRAAKFTGASFK